HPERLVHGVRHTHAVQQLAHEAARREYNVESGIQPTQIATKRALGETAAEAAPQYLWQIGVIERCDRNAALACNLTCRPGRLEGVARLDEARTQGAQHPAPAARIQRQTVVESARNRK